MEDTINIKGRVWLMKDVIELHECSQMKKDFCIALGYTSGSHYDRIIKRLGLNAEDFGKRAEDFYGKPVKNGDKFGLLTVIDANCEKTEKHGDKKSKCLCECGETTIVRNVDLRRGDTLSCGCLSGHNKGNEIKNGDIFGNLTVIDANCTHSTETTRPWLMSKCHCICGNEILVRNCNLRNEDRNFSCGCQKSIGEQKLIKALKELSVNYQYQKFLEINTRKMFLDFAILDKDDNIKCIIEYNGKQHYMPIDYFGGKEKFQEQIKRDELLKQYCNQNNILLVEIPYTDLNKINKDFILEKIGDIL